MIVSSLFLPPVMRLLEPESHDLSSSAAQPAPPRPSIPPNIPQSTHTPSKPKRRLGRTSQTRGASVFPHGCDTQAPPKGCAAALRLVRRLHWEARAPQSLPHTAATSPRYLPAWLRPFRNDWVAPRARTPTATHAYSQTPYTPLQNKTFNTNKHATTTLNHAPPPALSTWSKTATSSTSCSTSPPTRRSDPARDARLRPARWPLA